MAMETNLTTKDGMEWKEPVEEEADEGTMKGGVGNHPE